MKKLFMFSIVICLGVCVFQIAGCAANRVSEPADPYPLRVQSANRLFFETDLTNLKVGAITNIQQQQENGLLTQEKAQNAIDCLQRVELENLAKIYRASAARIYTLDELEMLYQFEIHPTSKSIQKKIMNSVYNLDQLKENMLRFLRDQSATEELEKMYSDSDKELGRVEMFKKYRKFIVRVFGLSENEIEFVINYWDNDIGRSIAGKESQLDKEIGPAMQQELDNACPGVFPLWQ